MEVIYDPARQPATCGSRWPSTYARSSIEDPLFRTSATNLEPRRLFQAMGIEDETLERGRLFFYDIDSLSPAKPGESSKQSTLR